MTERNTMDRNVATLETAPTRYVEGGGIRFAYRRLGLSTGTPLVLLQHFWGNIDAWSAPLLVGASSSPSQPGRSTQNGTGDEYRGQPAHDFAPLKHLNLYACGQDAYLK